MKDEILKTIIEEAGPVLKIVKRAIKLAEDMCDRHERTIGDAYALASKRAIEQANAAEELVSQALHRGITLPSKEVESLAQDASQKFASAYVLTEKRIKNNDMVCKFYTKPNREEEQNIRQTMAWLLERTHAWSIGANPKNSQVDMASAEPITAKILQECLFPYYREKSERYGVIAAFKTAHDTVELGIADLHRIAHQLDATSSPSERVLEQVREMHKMIIDAKQEAEAYLGQPRGKNAAQEITSDARNRFFCTATSFEPGQTVDVERLDKEGDDLPTIIEEADCNMR